MADYKTISDNELVSLLKESDHSAFNEIYHRYFTLIYVHAYKKLMDEDQAKDIIQELFTKLWFKRESLPEINNLAAYLISATRNKIFDLFAHEQVKQKHYDSLHDFLSSSPVVSTDYNLREVQFKAYIDQQIAALPIKMRVIFEMSRKEELSYKEIAEQLNTSENNVSKQVNNALRLLKTKLGAVLYLYFLIKL
jgi:RNA polymerase sigma-70 factor (ECF subfamily)